MTDAFPGTSRNIQDINEDMSVYNSLGIYRTVWYSRTFWVCTG